MAKKTGKRFRISRPTEAGPTDPESLFRDLRGRSPEIRHLWSHQADILRAYDRDHLNASDVALELPTGAGKTLIGLILGEYRRRRLGHRVAYLCPTRQLAKQVLAQSERYGISAQLAIPPQYDGVPDFLLGESIAVTTYAAVFNINPRIDSAQTLILDDAHAGGDYVAGLWTVRIDRENQADLYDSLIGLLAPTLSDATLSVLRDDDASPHDRFLSLDAVPMVGVIALTDAMAEIIDVSLEGDARYSWQQIRAHLHACHVYCAWHEILIRPYIPPTFSHAPFADASQRVYMSATLGQGGELERITGVPRIERIPMPEGWDKQSTGRRFFIFPNAALDEAESVSFSIDAADRSGRSLVIAPRFKDLGVYEESLADKGCAVFNARDIEDGVEDFVAEDSAALLLANRYDGLDLPDDACRLLVFYGLPVGVNLQEQFLFTCIGVDTVLEGRVRTRFTQGVGRCCRNDTDYSAVIVVGQRLFDFCARAEVRQTLHPELQAEMQFGLDNSREQDAEGLFELLGAFESQDDEWREVESALTEMRATRSRETDAATKQLDAVVAHEIRHCQRMWQSDFDAALLEARHVTDGLDAAGLGPYRAWWKYMSACAAAFGVASGDTSDTSLATRQLVEAASAAPTVSWFVRARRVQGSGEKEHDTFDALEAIERVWTLLSALGFNGRKFERHMSRVSSQLDASAADPFETGLNSLGEALGCVASRPSTTGDPDGIWVLSPKMAIAFEAKSGQKDASPITLGTVRQTITHEKWTRDNVQLDTDADIVTVLLSGRSTIAEDAVGHVGDLRYLSLSDLRSIADEVATILRSVRAECFGQSAEFAKGRLNAEFERAGLLPQALLGRIASTRLADLPVGQRTVSA